MTAMSYLRTVAGCIPALVPGERAVLWISGIFLSVSIFFGVLMGALSVWAQSNLPQSDAPAVSTLGIRLATQVASVMDTGSSSDRPRPLSGANVMVVSEDPARRAAGRALVAFAGGVPTETTDNAHVKIEWNVDKEEWRVSSLRPDDPQLAAFAWFSLRRSALPFQHATQDLGLPDPHLSVVFYGGRPVIRDGRYYRFMMSTLLYLCVMVPAAGLLFLSTGVLSFDLDRERTTGSLEAFSLAARPISALFLARALVRAALPTVGLLVMVSIAGIFVGFPHPVALLLGLALTFAVAVALGMIGQVQVVWYHHMYSRFVGQLLFNPGMLLMLFVFFFGGRSATWILEAATATAKGNDLPIVGWTPDQVMSVCTWLLPAALTLVVLCCLVVDWRLGTRRHGLSRVV